jgi:hypothetical protein
MTQRAIKESPDRMPQCGLGMFFASLSLSLSLSLSHFLHLKAPYSLPCKQSGRSSARAARRLFPGTASNGFVGCGERDAL